MAEIVDGYVMYAVKFLFLAAASAVTIFWLFLCLLDFLVWYFGVKFV